MHPLHSLQWRTRLLTSADYWRLTCRQRATRSDVATWHDPAAECVDRDGSLQCWRIDARLYWIPADDGFPAIRDVYEEVFRPDHPHHYVYKACRIRPGDTVVDAGASEGFFTHFALQQGARVLVLEPSAVYVDCLRRTFATEIAQGSVCIRRALVGSEIRKVPVSVHPCGWVTDVPPGSDPFFTVEEVDEVTLDAVLEETGWSAADFIKMDIEGAERKAVAGAHRTLAGHHPCLSIAVYHHPTGYLDVRNDLKHLGLGYRIAGKGTQGDGPVPIPKMLHAWPVA